MRIDIREETMASIEAYAGISTAFRVECQILIVDDPSAMGGVLHGLGYSLQANRKTRESSHHPDRDGRFRSITAPVRRFQKQGQPTISVGTKKKELIGNVKNGGRAWRPTRKPEPVRVPDFLIPAQGKAIPYGVYDLHRNAGWVRCRG